MPRNAMGQVHSWRKFSEIKSSAFGLLVLHQGLIWPMVFNFDCIQFELALVVSHSGHALQTGVFSSPPAVCVPVHLLPSLKNYSESYCI